MEDKILLIIKDLIDKTKKGEANWERINNADYYSLTLKSGKIFINKNFTKSKEEIFGIAIYNVKGDAIYSRNKLSPDNEFLLLKDLHSTVVKTFFKIDETIDGILGEIKSNGEIGEDTSLPF